MDAAGVVLVGGRSSRMGSAKADLEWHGSTLLYRTAAILTRALGGPVVVVRAPGQLLPSLPAGVDVVDDPAVGLGPLQGIATGLAAVANADANAADAQNADAASVAFVCATDLPFLHPAFVSRVVRALADPTTDVALPDARGHRQPLAAAYRTALAPRAAQLVAAGRLRPAFLLADCNVAVLDTAALLTDSRLKAADPDLCSLINVNDPDEYDHARARPAPTITVECFGTAARGDGPPGPRSVAAATLGGAAAAVGLGLDRHLMAAVNGDQITKDPQLPLVAGDHIAFLSADAGG